MTSDVPKTVTGDMILELPFPLDLVEVWWDRYGDKTKKMVINKLIQAVNVLSESGIPTGAIIMWSGTLANIPDGWELCDGVDGRPNLLDKFVKSVPNDSTDPGTTAGTTQHNHGGNTLEFHRGVTRTTRSNQGGDHIVDSSGPQNESYRPAYWWGVTTTSNHEPEHYEVAYIIKV